ncbi:MAG: DUF2490 domain-containing protein [Alloprevotella sp.]|nr:DUF2490 domain-containing protein [Alloprevotella sp.]
MHSLKHLSVLCACLLMAMPRLVAQDKFGLWGELGFQKSLDKHFSLESSIGLRTDDNLHSVSRIDLGTGLSYKPIKGLKLGVGYVFLLNNNLREVDLATNSSGNWNGINVDHQFWRRKHRIYVQAQGKLTLGRFGLSLRERYQMTAYADANYVRDRYRGIVTESYTGEKMYAEQNGEGRWYAYDETVTRNKASKTRHYLRSKATIEYNIRHCPLTPYASFEISNNLANGFASDKRRYTAGAEWRLTKDKKHYIDFGYCYTSGDDDDDEGNLHAIFANYTFKF